MTQSNLSQVAAGIISLLFIALPVAAAQNQASQPTKPKTESAAPKAISPEKVKELKDALELLNLDALDVQTAQEKFQQTNPVAKHAIETYQRAEAQSPEVKAARDKQDATRKGILAKIDALRKEQGLDETWDWDFNLNKFVQANPSKVNAGAPAKTKQ